MAEKFDTQIARFDGQGVFLEILNTAFTIGKVQMNFCTYDTKTHKQTNKLEIYLDMGKALALAEMIVNTELDRKIKEMKDSKKANAYTSYFTDMGGINLHPNGKLNKVKYDKLAEQFNWLKEDKDLSRQFKLQESTKYKYMLRAEYSLGHVDDKGLIVPEGKPLTYVQVPITEDDAYILAINIKMHIQAYWNQYYGKFGDKIFPKQSCNVFIPGTNNK